MIMDIISYIRSFLPTKRKRSATEDLDLPNRAKYPKTVPRVLEDDWLAQTLGEKKRKTFMEKSDLRRPWLKSTVTPTIVIDDDDPKKTSDGKRGQVAATSTPNSLRNGNGLDSFTLKYKDSIKKDNSRNDKVDILRPHSSYFTNSRVKHKSPLLSGIRDVTPKFVTPGIKKTGMFGSANMLSGMELSYRLDEKRKYSELLNKPEFISDYESFTEYSTPIGKIAPPISRSRRLLELGRNGKTVESTLLTNGAANKGNSKLSTKDTIIKVLDSMHNDVIVVKDSDSDVEILPTPPSPKPVFKINRVNSLRTHVDPSEPRHDEFLPRITKPHSQVISNKTTQIQEAEEKLEQIREINKEVKTKQLEEQVKKCLHIRDIVLPVEVRQKLPELTHQQLNMVKVAFDKSRPTGEILASKFSLSISRRDMLTLSGLNWLNDEVINFYMNLIIERGKLDKYPKVYAFNTFFYPKLLKDGHSSIRRWTRKIDVFSYDMICVPIHLSMHWCMAVIDFRTKEVFYYDSMGKPNHQCTEALLKYLQDEHQDKKKCEYNTSDWHLRCVKDIPQQMNGSDCGMFSCTYAEYSSRGAPFNFSQDQMPYFRQKMVVEITSGELLIN